MNLHCDCNNGNLEITFILGDINKTTFLLMLYLGNKIHVSRKIINNVVQNEKL